MRKATIAHRPQGLLYRQLSPGRMTSLRKPLGSWTTWTVPSMWLGILPSSSEIHLAREKDVEVVASGFHPSLFTLHPSLFTLHSSLFTLLSSLFTLFS